MRGVFRHGELTALGRSSQGARSAAFGAALMNASHRCVRIPMELPNSATEPDIAENLHEFYKEFAIPADSFARAVAFAMSQPEEVDVNEILFRPTRQKL